MVVDLSRHYSKSSNPLLRAVLKAVIPKRAFYWATCFEEARDYFKVKPPRRSAKDFWKRKALVTFYDLEARILAERISEEGNAHALICFKEQGVESFEEGVKDGEALVAFYKCPAEEYAFAKSLNSLSAEEYSVVPCVTLEVVEKEQGSHRRGEYNFKVHSFNPLSQLRMLFVE